MPIASFNHSPAPPHINAIGMLLGIFSLLITLYLVVSWTLQEKWLRGLLTGMFVTPLIWGLDAAWVETYAGGDMQSPVLSFIVAVVFGFIVGTTTTLLAIGAALFFRSKP